MPNNQAWTKEDLLRLYELKNVEGRPTKEICDELGRSESSVTKKFRRVNWDEFIKDPDAYLGREKVKNHSRLWTQDDMLQLDAYLQAGKSYYFISEKLDRGVIAVERKAQSINWKAWRALEVEDDVDEVEEDNSQLQAEIIDSLLIQSRYDSKRLVELVEKDFLEKVNLDKDKLPFHYKHFLSLYQPLI